MPWIVTRLATVSPIPSRFIALVCAALLACPAGAFATARQNVPEEAWQGLQTAAPGTEVEVTLTRGAKVRGRLIDAGADAVRMNANEVLSGSFVTAANTALRDIQSFRRSDVVTAKILGRRSRPSYRSAGGTPDAETVRRVVVALGVGKTVNLQTTTSRKNRTRIQAIGDDGFTIRQADSTAGLGVAYGDVVELEPAGMYPAAKGAIPGAAIAGGVLLLYLLNQALQG